jgi:D-psicose/D-tagatose/L-ribulose 3-epimerase
MHKVAISNIAWPQEAEREALSLCRRCGFTGIEISPSKSFLGWPRSPSDATGLNAKVADHGLTIVALQAILFGVDNVELFGSNATRARLAEHLRIVADLAASLGASASVYGAPKSRDPGDLLPEVAHQIAADFFAGVSPVFEAASTCLAFEANDASYGCRFITRTAEAIALVRRINSPGVRVQIDTGTIFLGREPPAVVGEAVPLAAHFHASEPQLRPLGGADVDHRPLATALRAARYDGWISVEMRETADWRSNIERAAKLMATVYRPTVGLDK